MCKYQKYQVKVTYVEGNTETINWKGINTNNYKEMLDVYRTTKDKYIDDVRVMKIDFIGLSNQGEMKIFFTKEFDNCKGKEELNKSVTELTNEIANNLQALKNKMHYHGKMIGALSKKRDEAMHNIENLKKLRDKNRITEEEYMQLKDENYKELEYSSIERRWHKVENENMQQLTNKNINGQKLNLTHLINIFNSIEDDDKEYEYLTVHKMDKLKLYTEVKYTTDKDKGTKESRLKKKYSNVIIDDANNIIYAYNKAN